MNRIQFLRGGHGLEFFIQAALFEHTGQADWDLHIQEGIRHNLTDQEAHYKVTATRADLWQGGDIPLKGRMLEFEAHGNEQDHTSLFYSALADLAEKEEQEIVYEKRTYYVPIGASCSFHSRKDYQGDDPGAG